ncbi:MAG: CehA/McbA family metallohydrolase [Defluviitaleaceae bacterium]|nr:CehA/McbA family metallohydrolase [Defluviitaleaceae bacterium]MCL2274536.1 CehA/McbA family metallohydrolase [Defluviitaleaceae bacterium]
MKIHFDKSQEKQYIKIPFDVPSGMERVDISGTYAKENGTVIDLAVLAPCGLLLGAAGGARSHVWISAIGSCAGFETLDPPQGTWFVLAGVYQLPEEGATVEYKITLTPKQRRLFKGDTHLHTVASDGTSDVNGLIALAQEQNLDFIFITDHNNTAQNYQTGQYPRLTVISGVEWTHFNGHALFLGAQKALTQSFGAEDWQAGAALVQKAKNEGAFTVIAHPLCHVVPWEWGFDAEKISAFHGIEVWNGVMSERNERATYFWHGLLCNGAKIPVTGGSDYHRPGLLGSVAMPCMCVYAPSRSPADIVTAMQNGNSFISYLPDGPEVDIFEYNESVLGATVDHDTPLDFVFANLQAGDEIRLITDRGTEKIICESGGMVTLKAEYAQCKFVRAEVYRSYAQGLPPMKALLSNPVYFNPA